MSIATLAQIPVVTDIAWNQSAFNKVGSTMHKWSKVDHDLKLKDDKILKDEVVDAYSRMRVEEYVDFSKTFSPIMKW
jgi:hypothetical protein